MPAPGARCFLVRFNLRQPFTDLEPPLVARGWWWDDKVPDVPALTAPHGTIWLVADVPWRSPQELLEVMGRRLARIETAGPLSDDVEQWRNVVADTRSIVDALRELAC